MGFQKNPRPLNEQEPPVVREEPEAMEAEEASALLPHLGIKVRSNWFKLQGETVKGMKNGFKFLPVQ